MKKKLNIILLIAVAALWGTVGYRFFKNYFSETDSPLTPATGNINVRNMIVERDTFQLKPLERDPFLNRLSLTYTPTLAISPRARVKNHHDIEIHDIQEKPWPDIQYYGYIKSGQKGELALVKINGTMSRVRKGELLKDLKIKNIYSDSIEIVYNKEMKTFKSS